MLKNRELCFAQSASQRRFSKQAQLDNVYER